MFNLNTIPALKYFRRGGECLIVLDDPESKTLYGTGHLCIMPWPKEIGKDEPVDLDSYPDNIRDFVRRLDDAEDNVEICRRDVESALSFASNANTNANTAVTTAQNAMSASSEAKTSAANALTDSAAAKKAAQDAEGLVSAAQNAAQSAQDAVENLADVAKSGSYNDLANKPAIPSIEGLATTNEVEKSEARSRAELLVEVSRAKTAEGELDKSIAKKADATALATETQRAKDRERDLEERIAALKSFDVKVVDALPISGISNTVYLVPSRKSADLNVRDEYLWLDGAWEQIGSTSVDLTDYAKKSELPRRPEDIGAQNALNPSQLAAVNSGITADKVAKMALKEDVPTKTSDLENDSNFAADVLGRTCVHEFPGGSVQACSGARVSATEWRFTDYENVVGIGQHYLLFSDGVWDFGKFSASGERMSMETVSAPFDAESLDFGAFGNVVFSGVDDMVARSGQIPKAYVKDAAKSEDGKTLTLTKNDGTIVSFQGGGGGGGGGGWTCQNKTLSGVIDVEDKYIYRVDLSDGVYFDNKDVVCNKSGSPLSSPGTFSMAWESFSDTYGYGELYFGMSEELPEDLRGNTLHLEWSAGESYFEYPVPDWGVEYVNGASDRIRLWNYNTGQGIYFGFSSGSDVGILDEWDIWSGEYVAVVGTASEGASCYMYDYGYQIFSVDVTFSLNAGLPASIAGLHISDTQWNDQFYFYGNDGSYLAISYEGYDSDTWSDMYSIRNAETYEMITTVYRNSIEIVQNGAVSLAFNDVGVVNAKLMLISSGDFSFTPNSINVSGSMSRRMFLNEAGTYIGRAFLIGIVNSGSDGDTFISISPYKGV